MAETQYTCDEIKDVGKRLCEERKRLGFRSQEKFASACDINPKTQCFYESGRTAPDTEYWLATIKLGLDIQYVLTGIRSVNLKGSANLNEEAGTYDYYSNVRREDVQRLRRLIKEQMEILK